MKSSHTWLVRQVRLLGVIRPAILTACVSKRLKKPVTKDLCFALLVTAQSARVGDKLV
jgi:hypothetical protein